MKVRALLAGMAVATGLATATARAQTMENPALSLLNPAITFYAGFDSGSAAADMAVGQAKPLSLEGTATFGPGRFGKALRIGAKGGGAAVVYSTAGNVDFTSPGAVSFWVTPVKWIDPDQAAERPYLHFLTEPAHGRGAIIIERMGFDKKSRRADRLISGYFNLSNLKPAMTAYNTLHWKAGDWRLIVMNWDANGFSTSFDGSAPHRVEFSRRLKQDDFYITGKGAQVIIGNNNAETSLIDELTFYNRPLSAAEIRAIAAK